jgi:GTP-binding protein Era
VDASESFGSGERFVLDLIGDVEKPSILVLNKVDLINKGRLLPLIEFYDKEGSYEEIIPLSALQGDNVGLLVDRIAEYLEEGEYLYPADYLTDQQERFLVAEVVREKVLELTRQELPYSSAVLVEEFDEEQRNGGFVRISASILVDKANQKKIVIGRGGQMIKQIGVAARKEIQKLLNVRKIYLDLNVKVIPGWRNRENVLDDLDVRRREY